MLGGKPRKNNDHSDDEDNKPKRGCGTSKTPGIGVKGRNTGKVHAVVANYNNEEGKQLNGKQLFAVLKKVCKGNNTVMYEGENETYIEASVENSSSILYDKEIRNKPRTRRTKRNV